MGDKPFSSLNAKPPPPPAAKPVEPLWSIRVKNVEWSAELRLHRESWVWEAQLFRAGEFFGGYPSLLREQAIKWATERMRDIERGWIDDWRTPGRSA